MKGFISKNGLWKAIAFLTVVIFIFSCTSCDPVIENPSWITNKVDSVTNHSAILVAEITPDQDVNFRVSFDYQIAGGSWETLEMRGYVNGQRALYVAGQKGVKVKVTQPLDSLEIGATYNYKVRIVYSGEPMAEAGSFNTLALPIVKAGEAERVTRTSATLVAWVTPNDESEISFDYRVNSGNWKSQTLTLKFNGRQALKVTLDLSDLEIGAHYDVIVRAKNKSGEVKAQTSFDTYSNLRDWDGNYYRVVTIGSQVWLQENFKGKHFANGDPIPNITDQAEWEAMKTPAYCHYDNNPANTEVYGALYNWYVASDPRGLIVGYHTPSLDEWTALANYLGGAAVAGGKMKEVGYEHWIAPNTGATNSSGFSGLPGGGRGDKFGILGNDANFWSTTPLPGLGDVYFSPTLYGGANYLQLAGGCNGFYGLGIRLIKN